MGEVLGVGTQVTRSLRLVRRLGGGGMGAVWSAHHSGLDAHVVVKFIAQEIAEDSGTLERFKREAAAAARVRSPHVVQILDYGLSDGGTPYIVMELLEGQDLGGRLAIQPILPYDETVAIIKQVSRALGKAHELGIVHRDIKPENIFLCDNDDDEPFVKLLDFGIAKAGRNPGVTTTGAAVGTPHYMSPEQMIGAKWLDHRSDLWSLGVLVFFMLTGRRPFTGETTGALAIAIHGGRIPMPTEYNSALPKAVDAWFAKACARDVDARYPSAKALSSALAEALLGRAASRPDSNEGSVDEIVDPSAVVTVRGAARSSDPETLEKTVRSVRGEPLASSVPEKSTAALASAITNLPLPKRSLLPFGLVGLVVLSAVSIFVWVQRDPGTPPATHVTETTAAAPPVTPTTPAPLPTPSSEAPRATASETPSVVTAVPVPAAPSSTATISAPPPKSTTTITTKPIGKPTAPATTAKPPAPKPPSDDNPDLK